MTPEEEKNTVAPLAPEQQEVAQDGVMSVTGSNAPAFWNGQAQQPAGNAMPGVEMQPATVETQTGGKTGSSTETTTTTKTVSPYEQFKGNNYKDLEDYLQAQIDAYKPETEEEREKREKREKRVGFLARLADGLGTLHTVYSYARGVKPMDMPQMSARATELFERAKKQRDANNDRRLNYMTILGKLRDANRNFGYQVAVQEQKDKQHQEAMQWNKDEAERQQRNKDRDFDEGQRRFDVEQKGKDADRAQRAKEHADEMNMKRAQLNLQRAQHNLQKQLHDNSQVFTLGEGNGSVKVPREAINSHNFSAIYNSLPKEYRMAQGDPIYSTDARGKKVISGYSAPNAEQMAIAVGAFLGDESIDASQKTATRTALAQLGKKTGGNNMTMPGIE